jgi:uncharacterized repeat protein (TIGR03833 family)
MGKRKRPSPVETHKATTGTAPFNNPFASLSGLRDELPARSREQPTPELQAPRASDTDGLADCPKLVVQRERKGRAGKTVTRICGLPSGRVKDVATRLKSALGCGATVEDQDLVVLGDLADRVTDWLRKEGAPRVVVSRGTKTHTGKGPRPPSPAASWREGTRRADLEPGLTVDIVLKRDQPTGTLTRGEIQDILTRSATHPHGIKVRLTDGQVGRVKRVVGE